MKIEFKFETEGKLFKSIKKAIKSIPIGIKNGMDTYKKKKYQRYLKNIESHSEPVIENKGASWEHKTYGT
jgi:hypothetical protein